LQDRINWPQIGFLRFVDDGDEIMHTDVMNQGESGSAHPGALCPSDHAEQADRQRMVRSVAGHGFIEGSDILALLCQLDADAVLDRLNGADGGSSPGSACVTASRHRYDRRASRRFGPGELRPDLRLAIQGVSARIVNLSETGVLVETSTSAIAGPVADLYLFIAGGGYTLRAQTVRSSVSAISPGSIVYRTALRFEQPLPLRDLLRK
jgi:hypothetical protein